MNQSLCSLRKIKAREWESAKSSKGMGIVRGIEINEATFKANLLCPTGDKSYIPSSSIEADGWMNGTMNGSR